MLFVDCRDLDVYAPVGGSAPQADLIVPPADVRMGGSAPNLQTGGSAPDLHDTDRPDKLHIGTHSDYVRWVFSTSKSTRCFERILTTTKRFLDEHKNMRPKLIVCYCKWGKHRSPAGGGVVVLLPQTGHTVRGVGGTLHDGTELARPSRARQPLLC